ncbi:MAG: hypothetical protein GY810_12190 [Aureispira sp.]|nr:hypothetical protein [Aureispira sp.]
MNLTVEQEQILDQLQDRLEELRQLQEQDSEAFKNDYNKLDKAVQKKLKFYITCIKKINQLRAQKENASTKKQAKIAQKIEKIKGQAEKRGIEMDAPQTTQEEDDHIPKGVFFRVVNGQLKDSLTATLGRVPAKNDIYKVNLSEILVYLGKRKYETPLGDTLRSKLVAKLQSLDTSTITIEDIKASIQDVVNILSKESNLKKHYNENNAVYTTKEDSEELFKTDLGKDITGFYSVLDILEDNINDPTHPKAIELKEAQEAALKAERKKFEGEYYDWKKVSHNVCATVDSTYTEKSLPKDKVTSLIFEHAKPWALIQPELTQDFSANVLSGLPAQETVLVKDCIDAMNHAITNLKVSEDLLFVRWRLKVGFPILDALKAAVQSQSEKEGENTFFQIYMNWFKEVRDAVDALKYKDGQRFNKDKVLEDLKAVFTISEHSKFISNRSEKIITKNGLLKN